MEDYKIIQSASLSKLESITNQLIEKGYVPHGSIVVALWRGNPIMFYQTLIRANLLNDAAEKFKSGFEDTSDIIFNSK